MVPIPRILPNPTTAISRIAGITFFLLIPILALDLTVSRAANTSNSESIKSVEPATYADLLVEQARDLLDARPPDLSRAVGMLEAAQAADNLNALLLLAEIYMGSYGSEENPEGAQRLLTRVTRGAKHPQAWTMLAKLYLNHPALADPASVEKAFQRALKLGDKSFKVAYARKLAEGRGVPRNVDRARELLTEAITAGEPEGFDALGDLLSKSQSPDDLERAIESYRTAIKAGHPGAAPKLAKLLVYRAKDLADFTEAERLLKAEIDAGDNFSAPEVLGDLYRKSRIFGDPNTAAKAYRTAADAGNPAAMLKLAKILMDGDGVDRDPGRAQELLISAVTLGDGPHADLEKAVAALRAAIDLGVGRSLLRLGQMYAKGEYVTANFELAETLLQKAIAAGANAWGYFALGELYSAKGPTRDAIRAADMFRKAASAGNIWGAYHLAKMTAKGDGVVADPNAARRILETAIADIGGNTAPAWLGLGNLFSDPGLSLYDVERAVEAYAKAAAQGHSWAKIRLGTLLSDGSISPPDYDRAERLFTEVAEAGHAGIAEAKLGALALKRDLSSKGISRARYHYERAAADGSVEAHLALATLANQDFGEVSVRMTSLAHFKKAAKLSNPRRVFVEMMKLAPGNLILLTQQLLQDAGQSISVDGISDSATGQAIMKFCREAGVRGCRPDHVTWGLIVGLLTHESSGHLPPKRRMTKGQTFLNVWAFGMSALVIGLIFSWWRTPRSPEFSPLHWLKPTTAEFSVVASTVVLIAAATLSGISCGLSDDHIFIMFYFRGTPYHVVIWPSVSRFFPLGHQEWRLFYNWITDVRAYHAFAFIQYAIFGLGVAAVMKATCRTNWLFLLFVMTAPAVLIPFGNLLMPERNLLMLLPLWILTYVLWDRSHYIYLALLNTIITNTMLYFKEPVVVFIGLFSGLAILRVLLRRFDKKPRSKVLLTDCGLDLVLLLSCGVFASAYLSAMDVQKIFNGSGYYGHSFSLTNIVPTLWLWLETDPLTILLLVGGSLAIAAQIWRYGLGPSDRIFFAAGAYLLVPIYLGMVHQRYSGPPFVAAALSLAAIVPRWGVDLRRYSYWLIPIIVINLILAAPHFMHRYDWFERNRQLVDTLVARSPHGSDLAATKLDVFVEAGDRWDVEMLAVYANQRRSAKLRFVLPIEGFHCHTAQEWSTIWCGYQAAPMPDQLILDLGNYKDRTARLRIGDDLVWQYDNRYARYIRGKLPKLFDDILWYRYSH